MQSFVLLLSVFCVSLIDMWLKGLHLPEWGSKNPFKCYISGSCH